MRRKLHEYVRLTPRHCTNPQDHLFIDLLVPYNITSQGNLYALTALCNLTGCLMTTPIRDKKVGTHLFADIMLTFEFPRILHLDNDVVFKYELM